MNKHLMNRVPPQVLLILTTLFWAGNLVVGRAFHEDIPPVGLAFWRWLVVLALISPVYLPQLRTCWPVIRRSWKIMVVLSILGVFNFTVLAYVGLHYTTVVNASRRIAGDDCRIISGMNHIVSPINSVNYLVGSSGA